MLNNLLGKYLTNRYTFLMTDKGWLYFDNPKAYFENYLGYYLNLDGNEKLYNAVFSYFMIDDVMYRHGHQNVYIDRNGNKRGVTVDVCEKMYKKLISNNFKLEDFNSFKELYNYLLANRVSYYGVLSVYDLALRLGYTRQIKPQNLYLHSGASYGWRNLCKSLNKEITENNIIKKQELPLEFQEIECFLIEDFLCCYKQKLIF